MFTIILALASVCEARVIDRVAAFVDDYAITERDLDGAYAKAAAADRTVTRAAVLNSIIDRYLLVREARRAHIDYNDDETAVTEFLNIKVRSAILIPEDKMRGYYDAHPDEFAGKSYEDARDAIERTMMEEEFNRRLLELIKQLRASSSIRVLVQ